MNKELFVSSTPHETKVGLVENDQLAEIYLERENEYTLAGSIYKGRVTRVLPGMQSAFVDIGLERDAFLYVSDFLDLEDHDEDMTEVVPANRPVQQMQPADEPQNGDVHNSVQINLQSGELDTVEEQFDSEEAAEAPPAAEPGNSLETSETRPERAGRDFRGRRRRGRRDRNDRNDSRNDRNDRGNARDARPPRDAAPRPMRDAEPPIAASRPSGPPAGYQPILLPGESLSKYRGRPQFTAPVAQAEMPYPAPASTEEAAAAPAIHDHEPFFGEAHPSASEPVIPAHEEAVHEESVAHVPEPQASTSARWGLEYRQAEAAVEPAAPPAAEHTHDSLTPAEATELRHQIHQIHEESAAEIPPARFGKAVSEETASEETVEEEEEAETAHLHTEAATEIIEDDFDEFEEVTQGADGAIVEHHELEHHESEVHETAALEAAPGAESHGDADDDEEFEIEEAQAEAEALLAAEQGEPGAVASAEVRAATGTAGYTQRAPRPARERRGGQRGPQRSSGRRMPRRQMHDVPKISDLLKEGQEILVQIAKEPIGKKGARITSHIALPGRFLVYMPTVNHTGVSRKIASDEERQRLKRIVNSERENGTGGFIVRTAAARATEDELRADIRFLKGLWNDIKSRADSAKPPALIYHDLNVVERVLRDLVTSDFGVIWVDTEPEYERILRFFTRFQPALVKRVKLYTKEEPLFEQFGLAEEMNKALRSKVWLKSGGYIVINQTEALVAIDINTGKYVGKTARLEDTIVKTNIDAIKEIVRQVRLRDLGGIIIIDFIDMDERRNRQRVMQALEEEMRLDRAPSKVLQFNDFGLVAITRKRVKQSLERTLGTPCPYCESTGYVKSVTTVCNELYIEMRKIAKHLEHEDVILRVNPEVGKELKANNARLLTEMEEMTKRTIIIKSDPALHQEKFDIN